MGWSGMRGGVSLAAALALPLTTDAGAELADRDLILFITYGVILVTVVGQGLTLPPLIRKLGVTDDGSDEESEELYARLTSIESALDSIDQLAVAEWTVDDSVDRARNLYEFRRRRFKTLAGTIEDEDGIVDRSVTYQQMMHVIYDAQRAALLEVRNNGLASAEVIRRIERELDLEERAARDLGAEPARDGARIGYVLTRSWEARSDQGALHEPVRPPPRGRRRAGRVSPSRWSPRSRAPARPAAPTRPRPRRGRRARAKARRARRRSRPPTSPSPRPCAR